MIKRKPLPSRIYVERWPDESREDTIHYAPTGYGVDLLTGKTSRVAVYRRVTAKELAIEKKGKGR